MKDYEKQCIIQGNTIDHLFRENEILKAQIQGLHLNLKESAKEFTNRYVEEIDRLNLDKNNLQMNIEMSNLRVEDLKSELIKTQKERDSIELSNNEKDVKIIKIKKEVEDLRAFFEEREKIVFNLEENLLMCSREVDRLHEIMRQKNIELEEYQGKILFFQNSHIHQQVKGK